MKNVITPGARPARNRPRSGLWALAATLTLAACAAVAPPAPDVVARWNHRPEAAQWNASTMAALQGDGARMLARDLSDIDSFCPGYARQDAQGRAAFWLGLMSVMARYESGWNPQASGAGGRYRGLMQISPQTARHHGCDLAAGGLYDGATNLACAVRIMSAAVTRDGVVATGRGGVAADWPPMRDATKRAEAMAFTRALPACAP
jgi:hypothetical protein